MILGNGLIANELKKIVENKNKVIYIASGVSNSSEVDEDKFLREESLVKSTFNLKSKIVYFSTCSIYDKEYLDSPYVRHKLRMENLVISTGNFFIFRLPQVVGFSKNNSTLVNYLANKIKNKEKFVLWTGALRNLIDVHDLALMVNYCVKNNLGLNKVSNLANTKFYTVDEIVKELEFLIRKEADYLVINKNNNNNAFCTKLSELISNKLKIEFDDNYLKNTLKKYYDIN